MTDNTTQIRDIHPELVALLIKILSYDMPEIEEADLAEAIIEQFTRAGYLLLPRQTDEDLNAAEIQRRLSSITPGEWKASEFGRAGEQEPSSLVIHSGKFNWQSLHDGEEGIAWLQWGAQEFEDATFIAHAPKDVAALLEQHRRDKLEIARLRQQVDAFEMFFSGLL